LAGGPTQELSIFRNLRVQSTGIKVYEDLCGDVKFGDNSQKRASSSLIYKVGQNKKSLDDSICSTVVQAQTVYGLACPSTPGKIIANFGASNQDNSRAEIGSMQMPTPSLESKIFFYRLSGLFRKFGRQHAIAYSSSDSTLAY
uniref:Omp85 domain-containing protein n=1 Tax=Angiostrongylus cantonensis TaxID=6313 RepID=A0A0K0D8N7_ANGCA